MSTHVSNMYHWYLPLVVPVVVLCDCCSKKTNKNKKVTCLANLNTKGVGDSAALQVHCCYQGTVSDHSFYQFEWAWQHTLRGKLRSKRTNLLLNVSQNIDRWWHDRLPPTDCYCTSRLFIQVIFLASLHFTSHTQAIRCPGKAKTGLTSRGVGRLSDGVEKELAVRFCPEAIPHHLQIVS